MRKVSLYICFSFLTMSTSFSQDLRFDKYTRELLFEVTTDKPDTLLTKFMSRCFPHPLPYSWDSSGSKGNKAEFPEEIHTYLFKQHPKLTIQMAQGGLDIYSSNIPGNPSTQQFKKIRLWFSFDQQADAEKAFGRLVENYLLISSDKQFSASNGIQHAVFSNTNNKTGINKVHLGMTVDNLDIHHFKILLEPEHE